MDQVDDQAAKQQDTNIQTDAVTTQKTENEQQPVVYKVNGREYAKDQVDQMAKDYENLEKEKSRLANEVGEYRKKATPPTPVNQGTSIDPTAKAEALKVLKDELGVLTKDEYERLDYAKQADAKLSEVSKKYGLDKERIAQELIDEGYRIPVEKFENFIRVNHPEEYDKYRQAQIEKDRPKTPHTERPVKEGIELPQGAERPRFGKNVLSQALELIGATKDE